MNANSMLEFLLSRRSVRQFAERPVEHDVIETLFTAATSAPSNTNRQPWRFAIVTGQQMKANIVAAIRSRAEIIKAIIKQGHHAEDFGNYGDFFFEPLQTAAVIVIPQFRDYPDLIADFIASGGADPAQFTTASAMQAERCSTSAAVMNLLLQAHASGLAGCWMAGPMIARDDIGALLGIQPPWHMLGAVALGYPIEPAPEAKPRKPLDKVVQWYTE